tara:strand:- start:559 stop:753 length:195 start_codon:yes stop_codon:yes gene_type:complete
MKTTKQNYTEIRVKINNTNFYSTLNSITNKVEYWRSEYTDNDYYITFQYKNEKGFNKAINKLTK